MKAKASRYVVGDYKKDGKEVVCFLPLAVKSNAPSVRNGPNFNNDYFYEADDFKNSGESNNLINAFDASVIGVWQNALISVNYSVKNMVRLCVNVNSSGKQAALDAYGYSK